MFEGKIEGRNRNNLQQHLTSLYNEGLRCLLRCPSLQIKLSRVCRMKNMSFEAIPLGPCGKLAGNLIIESFNTICEILVEKQDMTIFDHQYLLFKLHDLASSANNSTQTFILRIWFQMQMQRLCAYVSSCAMQHRRCNKLRYQNLIKIMKMLSRYRIDYVCHFLYQAILYYNNKSYEHALQLGVYVKESIQSEGSFCICSMHSFTFNDTDIEYLTLETVMRKSFCCNVRLFFDQSIPELYFETHAKYKISFRVPPFVFALFLQFLCYSKLGHIYERDESLHQLSILINQTNGGHVCKQHLSEAYLILGICQEIRGNDSAACHFFLMALRNKYMTNTIAACIRLGTILVKYFI